MTTNLTGETNQFYFPGLNGLRFLAALVVILQHIEYFKSILGFNQFACTSFIFNLGGLGVSFFFVLSGFLITFLLLTEKLQYNSISIKNFYIKRILRIWPVYYLLVLCGLFIFPHIGLLYNQDYKNFYDNFGTKVILFMLFFPNVALIKFGVLPFIAPTWSVGVEEQFYLIWPWLIRLSKKYLLILILITLSASFVFHVASYLSTEVKNAFFAKSFFIIKRFLKYFRIGSMAIGGIGAYLLILKKQSVLNIIYRIEFQFLIGIALFICLYKKFSPPFFMEEFYAVLFCLIIINVSTNSKSILKFENKLFNSLGKISYGLYLYHAPIICIVVKLAAPFLFRKFNFYFSNICLYTIALSASILISFLSFYFIEKRFLDLKKYFPKGAD